ncbi:MAG TPA: histidine phosphatase family protein [Actinomycetota bacterium]|nr:histidine phosphatase family protein [Actinomycetota bacterium]
MNGATRIIVVRHGQTPASVERRFAGSTDVDLTDEGAGQAELLAARLSKLDIEALYVSPMKRCRRTSAAVERATGLVPRVERDLRECDFGRWEGLTTTEVSAQFPDRFQEWVTDDTVEPPDGESWHAVGERLGRWWESAAAEHKGQTIVAVTHGGPILTLIRQRLQAPYLVLLAVEIDPCSITVFQARRELWRVRLVNDTTHLRDPLLDGPPPKPMPP